jgi:hypothetical protein
MHHGGTRYGVPSASREILYNSYCGRLTNSKIQLFRSGTRPRVVPQGDARVNPNAASRLPPFASLYLCHRRWSRWRRAPSPNGGRGSSSRVMQWRPDARAATPDAQMAAQRTLLAAVVRGGVAVGLLAEEKGGVGGAGARRCHLKRRCNGVRTL